MPDPTDAIEITVEEPAPSAKPLAAALAEAQRDEARRERDAAKREADKLKAESEARATAEREAKEERQRAVRMEVQRRFDRLPAPVRDALGKQPTVKEQVAAIRTHEATMVSPSPRPPGAALMPPNGLGSPPRAYTADDLERMTHRERMEIYKQMRGGVALAAASALVDALRPPEAVDQLAKEGVHVGPSVARTR